MKAKIKGIERVSKELTVIECIMPQPVTSSKHVKLLAGIKRLLEGETDSSGEIYFHCDMSPFVLAETFLELLQASIGEGTKSYILAESLTKFPKRDFVRFGDTNCLNDVSRAWFSDSGTHIDVQAEIIEDVHKVSVSTNDIIEHVMAYKPGQYMQPLETEIEEVRSQFLENFGFRLTLSYAEFLKSLNEPVNKNPDFDLPF